MRRIAYHSLHNDGMKHKSRQKLEVGNWKMHTAATEAALLAKAVADGFGGEDRVWVGISFGRHPRARP
jgi:hypothetical protein